MSELPLKEKQIDFLINGNKRNNMLNYIKSQALANNEVIHIFDIKNSLLLNMANQPNTNYVEAINNIIPGNIIRIMKDCKRVIEKMRILTWRVKNQVKKLNRKGSRTQRDKYLENWSKLSILVGDVMTASEYEQEIKRVEQQAMERTKNLNMAVEEWKKKFKNLEEEKKLLYTEMMEHHLKEKQCLEEKIHDLDNDKENMRKYITELEKASNPPGMKDFADLSKRQQKRRVQALSSRAEKALWFVSHFGLELDAIQFRDKSGQKHPMKLKTHVQPSTVEATPSTQTTPTPSGVPLQPQTAQFESLTYQPSLPSTSEANYVTNQMTSETSASQQSTKKNRWRQYENISEDDKCKVESLLFLMDKFAVGDAFLHEISMVIDGMPKSYLVKQCRDKLNSTCNIRPTPGSDPGAQISFKESLSSKLKILVSTLLTT